MLPDFRFVLGAILAIALLAVAGLGLVTSVHLAHEARMNPLEDSRSLAYAGHSEWNQFYDPDAARRFEGLAGKPEGPLAPARLETPAETSPEIVPLIAPSTAPSGPEERTASIPAHRRDPEVASEVADDKTPESSPPPPTAETPAAVTIAALPAETVGAPAPDAPGTGGPDAPPAGNVAPPAGNVAPPAGNVAPPAGLVAPPAERVASAPIASPGPELPQDQAIPPQPQATGDPPQDAAPPVPRARPKAHFRKKIARLHIRSVGVAKQTWPNSGIPTNAPWPGYDNQFTDATTAKKTTGKLTGTLANRPQ